MFEKSCLRLLVLLLALSAVACSSTKEQVALEGDFADREVAAANVGIPYPKERTFDLKDFKGKSYLSVVQKKIKPALDSLSSRAAGGGGGFENVGAGPYQQNAQALFLKTLAGYRGENWPLSLRLNPS